MCVELIIFFYKIFICKIDGAFISFLCSDVLKIIATYYYIFVKEKLVGTN